MDKYECRRRNLALLRDTRCDGRNSDMARRLGKDASYVSRMLYPEGKAGKKRIADEMREQIERAFGLQAYALDTPLSEDSISTDGVSQSDSTTLKPMGHESDLGQGSDFGGEVAIAFRGIPVVGMAQFGDGGFFEELQYPVGHGSGYVAYPSRDQNAYALRGEGNSMAPRFRHGEFIIVEPGTEVFQGDEVVVKLRDGRVMGKIWAYTRDGMAYFDSINQAHSQISVPAEQVELMHFIAGVAKRSLFRPA